MEERTLQDVLSTGPTNVLRGPRPTSWTRGCAPRYWPPKEDGDSVGGVVHCLIDGLPVGLGEPFFDTVDGELAKMMFAIPAVKGIEFGAGFAAAGMRGSRAQRSVRFVEGRVRTAKNDAGGVLGGISNGMPLDFRGGLKAHRVHRQGAEDRGPGEREGDQLKIEGRHDPCIVPAAVVVVEAVAALVMADLMHERWFHCQRHVDGIRWKIEEIGQPDPGPDRESA